ncbi:LRRGT00167 [Rattus norvegicus]|uniref:LRRGT00167 n=2 Tax=Rattus norvegicus TaxID=10116 RepID=F7F4J5_RAT|nr:LRRGT00167 [Rattus norvegicus]EDL89798.1 LRRGT00167 [Rattus norvegicus]|eukprot:NP_001041389.1 uncharacterized protein LOC498155 [Rattus norvegicus]
MTQEECLPHKPEDLSLILSTRCHVVAISVYRHIILSQVPIAVHGEDLAPRMPRLLVYQQENSPSRRPQPSRNKEIRASHVNHYCSAQGEGSGSLFGGGKGDSICQPYVVLKPWPCAGTGSLKQSHPCPACSWLATALRKGHCSKSYPHCVDPGLPTQRGSNCVENRANQGPQLMVSVSAPEDKNEYPNLPWLYPESLRTLAAKAHSGYRGFSLSQSVTAARIIQDSTLDLGSPPKLIFLGLCGHQQDAIGTLLTLCTKSRVNAQLGTAAGGRGCGLRAGDRTGALRFLERVPKRQWRELGRSAWPGKCDEVSTTTALDMNAQDNGATEEHAGFSTSPILVYTWDGQDSSSLWQFDTYKGLVETPPSPHFLISLSKAGFMQIRLMCSDLCIA